MRSFRNMMGFLNKHRRGAGIAATLLALVGAAAGIVTIKGRQQHAAATAFRQRVESLVKHLRASEMFGQPEYGVDVVKLSVLASVANGGPERHITIVTAGDSLALYARELDQPAIRAMMDNYRGEPVKIETAA